MVVVEMATNATTTSRDAGFALLSRINRWLIAAAVAVAGFLSIVASHAFHGHTTASAAASSATGGAASPSSGSSGSTGLSQASQPPAAANSAPPAVVSGGS
jgi:hypothetical protein